ncbi:AMP-binding protein [Heliobacillus mobilis]|uniref:AMP-binding protein n=1 Tax=Heliobacterium mobile TaxID=28064 RepID=A0A6I3SNT5_HELMO|nr:AMP-binding protein [Heliobacterium mobile]MTV50396.1 AMP-binding protein [Heliobacterium mobile]
MELPAEKRFLTERTHPLLTKYFMNHDADTMPTELMATYQEEALQEIITHAAEKSPFYREKFQKAGINAKDIQNISDLSKLPFTTKDELRGDPWRFLTCDKKNISIIHVSTGTTGGEPIYVMHTYQDFFLNDLAPGFCKLVPVEEGDIVLNALPYEMSSAGLAFHKSFIHCCSATVLTAGKGGAYSTPEKTVKMMRDLKPTVAITSPSYAVTLAETAAKEGFDLTTLPLKLMWITGEGCSPAFRQRVEKLWGTTANFYYGTLEGGVIGIECNNHAGYHIANSHVIVEIVNPTTGEVLEPLEIGEIVVTCLARFGTPLIRYRTQDLGYIDPEPCDCGTALPRIFLRGRLGDQVRVNNIDFSPFYLEEFLMRQPEVGNWYQFVAQPGNNDVLKIRVELAPGVVPSPALADKLSSKMEFAFGVPCEIVIVPEVPRPRAKTVRVIRSEEETA